MPSRDKAQEGEIIKRQGHGKRLLQVFSDNVAAGIDHRYILVARQRHGCVCHPGRRRRQEAILGSPMPAAGTLYQDDRSLGEGPGQGPTLLRPLRKSDGPWKCPCLLPAWKAGWILAGGDSHRLCIRQTIRPGRGGGHHPRSGRHHSRAPSGRMILPGHFPGIPSPANIPQPSGLNFGFPSPGIFCRASTVAF